MDKETLTPLKIAIFDSFWLAFCYGLGERSNAMMIDGIPTGLELGQIAIVLLLIVALSFLNPRTDR
jgi:hypothetical protein